MVEKIQIPVIEDSLKKYESFFDLPSFYRHRKTQGVYEAKEIAYREEDMVACVVYHPLGHPKARFVRPVNDFMLLFEHLGQEIDAEQPVSWKSSRKGKDA